LAGPDREVPTAELKVNLAAPAGGAAIVRGVSFELVGR
jgi:hypothetical protein